jgi:hypothetical protein
VDSDRSLDLDLAATEIATRVPQWTSRGLRVDEITWTDATILRPPFSTPTGRRSDNPGRSGYVYSDPVTLRCERSCSRGDGPMSPTSRRDSPNQKSTPRKYRRWSTLAKLSTAPLVDYLPTWGRRTDMPLTAGWLASTE